MTLRARTTGSGLTVCASTVAWSRLHPGCYLGSGLQVTTDSRVPSNECDWFAHYAAGDSLDLLPESNLRNVER